MAEKIAFDLVAEAEPIYYADDGIDEILSLMFDEDDKDEDDKDEDEDEDDEELVLLEGDGIDLDDAGLNTPIEEEPVLNLDSGNNFDFLDNHEDLLPGAKIVLVKEEEPERETTWEDDHDHSKFIGYMLERLKGIPPHSGQTTVGCEKAISYLRKLDKEISKAIQSDESNTINEEEAEKIRDKIHEYVDTLEDALDDLVSKKRKKKKKASFSLGKKVYARINDGVDVQYFISVASSDGEERLFKVDVDEPTDKQVQAFMAGEHKGLTKEAGKLQVFVDPFLQSITRLIMRAHITQGKNIKEVFAQLNDQYKFTDREQLSIHEILLQKGLPVNADLGRLQEKDVSPMDSRNVEFSTEFYA